MSKALQKIAATLIAGYLVFFPDASQSPELQDLPNLSSKFSKSKILRLKSQMSTRQKTKLNDAEDISDMEEAPTVTDEESN